MAEDEVADSSLGESRRGRGESNIAGKGQVYRTSGTVQGQGVIVGKEHVAGT